jgi:hypothetical protein
VSHSQNKLEPLTSALLKSNVKINKKNPEKREKKRSLQEEQPES